MEPSISARKSKSTISRKPLLLTAQNVAKLRALIGILNYLDKVKHIDAKKKSRFKPIPTPSK